MLLSDLNKYIKSGQTVWYKGTIPYLTKIVSDYVSIETIAVLSIKYTGSNPYNAIRCQNATSTAGAFELWLYSGSNKPASATEDTSGTIKISYPNKTPQYISTEINKLKNWEATILYDCPRLGKGELWNYFGDYTYTFPRTNTGYWTNYTGLTWSPEKSFTGEYIIRANRFVALYDQGAALEIYDPGTVNIYSPWYLRINPGYFRIVNSTGSYLYGVPEYNTYTGWSQNKGKPYISIQGSVPLKVDGTLLFTQHKDIENIRVYINGIRTDRIKRTFKNHGIIEMSDNISTDLDIAISYDYLERFYLYRGLNLNPRLNPSVKDKYIIVYATPQTSILSGVTTTSTNCIHHVLGNTIEAAYENIVGATAVVLTVAKFSIPTGYSFLDLRTQGGGVIDINTLNTVQPESECYTNISSFSGCSYPGNGSIVISIPENVDLDKITNSLQYYLAAGIDYIVRKRS